MTADISSAVSPYFDSGLQITNPITLSSYRVEIDLGMPNFSGMIFMLLIM